MQINYLAFAIAAVLAAPAVPKTTVRSVSAPVPATQSLRVFQSTDASVGVLIVAHGADSVWNAPIEHLADEVRRDGVVQGPVAVAFLMGPGAVTHRFQDAVANLTKQGAKRVVVVPLLVSSYSGHFDQIRYLSGALDSLDAEMMHHLHMGGIERVTNVPISVAPALDDSPELAHMLARRAAAIAPNASDRAHRALFLFGHGPNSAEDYAAWMKNLRVVADSVRAADGFASVAVELVRDDAPAPVRAEAVKRSREIIGLQHAATRRDVVVVPILVSSGTIATTKLPGDLAGTPAEYVATPLLPDGEMVKWVERRVAEAAPTP